MKESLELQVKEKLKEAESATRSHAERLRICALSRKSFENISVSVS
jgi:hypothetical protein